MFYNKSINFKNIIYCPLNCSLWVRLCDVLTPASLVKGGGFAVGKIGGIVGNTYVFRI